MNMSDDAIGSTFHYLDVCRKMLLDAISMAHMQSIETNKRDLLEKLLDLSVELVSAHDALDGREDVQLVEVPQ
ncbi:MAG: hypothetical protein SFV15_16765 [Polyangiaceae bacterium]|nr:hypothetical protein [Polyangiaceae bacterium]